MTIILIVDDQPMTVMLVKAALQEVGPKVLVATTGQEAVDIYLTYPRIDLILMDLHMPDMNGLDATDAIRASAPYRQNPIPIIAMTANSLMEEKSKFLKTTGLADYITKPLSREKLMGAITRHLRKA